jgi:serine protease
MLPSRNRPATPSRRLNLQRLGLEALEDRTLLSTTPNIVLDLNNVAVSSTQYNASDILVRFQTAPGTPNGPALVAGTTLGAQLPFVAGLYEINLAPGMTVARALTAYKAEKGVLDAEPDYNLSISSSTLVPNDPDLNQQWYLNNTGQNGGTPGADIHAEAAWSVTSGSPNIIVAVMDTGVDYDSPDLYDNIWINPAEIPNYWYTKSNPSSGYDKIVYKSEIKTATPGIITFRDLNNPANAGLVWDNNGDGRIDAGDLLRPLSQGGWDNNSTQDGDTAHPDDLFGWNFVSNANTPLDDNGHGTNVTGILGAVGNNGTGVAGVDWNVQIMPLKFMGADGTGSISDFIEALNYAVQHGAKITNNSWEGAPPGDTLLYDAINSARAAGQIFVVAAGNESTNNDTNPDYPASYSQTLNNVVAVAATDNNDQLAGFSNYGSQSVALAAPGVSILSTVPGGYAVMSGTSMATPQVTGAMALVWGLHPSWTYSQVINQVLSTTDKLPSLQGKVTTGGRLDLAAAVDWNLSTRINPTITSVTPQGQTGNSINSLILTFSEPIDVSSFSNTSAQLTDPYGNTIPYWVSIVSNSGDRQVQLSFSNQSTPGNYSLSVGNSVYDLMGNALIPYQTTFTLAGTQRYSNNTAMAINPRSTVSSTIMGPTGVTIGHLQLQLNVSYPVDSDLEIYLTAPNGTIVRLISRWGNGANFTNTILDDAAPLSIGAGSAPYPGSYRPDANLSQLNNMSAAGAWTLSITNVGGHSGTLLGWSLVLTPTNTTSIQSGKQPYSNNTAMAINPRSTVSSTIMGPTGVTIGHLQLQLNVSYPVDSDLEIYLTAPNGTVVRLISRWGGNGANFTNTILDDAAPLSIGAGIAPYSGSYRPDANLSQLNNMSAAGVWTLSITDVGGHSGTLLGWSINFTPVGTTSAVSKISSIGVPVSASINSVQVFKTSSSSSAQEKPINEPSSLRTEVVAGIAPRILVDGTSPSTRQQTELLVGKRWLKKPGDSFNE